MLDAPFSLEEVEKVLTSIGPHKALGTDDFHAAFLQNNWGLMQNDILEACLKVLNGGESVKKINKTIVVLIPKNENLMYTDFRPISLCKVVYKIISKPIANRLRKVLGPLIAENQSAFVHGRYITDNAILAFELLHSMSKIYSGKANYMTLKIDMSKAYDWVEWDFDDVMLSKKGFPPRLRALILILLHQLAFPSRSMGS
ncbi:Unknown protein [Striga hermonthica]|uniref:Reverse transcriptase domain-containing protein n=1 Tax=Striga hermonthica TaxID=68872 RepID=A0A9N7MQ58_STRHE|nr:Unknown protein [Striga hermonthica]